MADAISDDPETVLRAGGTTARFNGARLRIVRGRTAWTVPLLQALRSADPRSPTRAGRPFTVALAFRTPLFASVAAVPATTAVLCLLADLPG
ncbi:hypothetical protein GCM10010129_34670 [Streptomyces fumigatiscleroticus]|nr:hypothetical protein GCM10010129_34670 [Streptomyces fumigatiscleroticus]